MTFIKLRNKSYPITISGSGIPCFTVGIGTLLKNTLPISFENTIRLFSTNLYSDIGMSDYNCCPWHWLELQLPENFTINCFDKSGHYPHYEEPELFMNRISVWMQTLPKGRP